MGRQRLEVQGGEERGPAAWQQAVDCYQAVDR